MTRVGSGGERKYSAFWAEGPVRGVSLPNNVSYLTQNEFKTRGNWIETPMNQNKRTQCILILNFLKTTVPNLNPKIIVQHVIYTHRDTS